MRLLEYVSVAMTLARLLWASRVPAPGAAEMQVLELKALVGSRTRERPREQESSTGARSAWEEPAHGERWVAGPGQRAGAGAAG